MLLYHASFFLTPIFYQFDMLPEYVQNILQFSPMVQILTMAHHVVLYGMLPTANSILYASRFNFSYYVNWIFNF